MHQVMIGKKRLKKLVTFPASSARKWRTANREGKSVSEED